MVRLLIIATLLAAIALALWWMWRATSATDPFAGVDNATLRAEARTAAESAVPTQPRERVREREQVAPPPMAQPEPQVEPTSADEVTVEMNIDEARLREQTRERALAEAQQRTTVTPPPEPAGKPWFVPVARPELPSEERLPATVAPKEGEPDGGTTPQRSAALPAWQRR